VAVERVLVVVAHPDDAEFWAGGTIAGWTDAGVEVTYCVLTDGDLVGSIRLLPARTFLVSGERSSRTLPRC
jgi:LmbE family N-acetylglucosaminyl deacetylase